MTNWDKISARGSVRKTVALHPIWDQYVRVTQATLLKQGMDTSYSLALNYMLLIQVFSAINQGIDDETRELMSSFLEDQDVINNLNLEDITIKYEETIRIMFTKLINYFYPFRRI